LLDDRVLSLDLLEKLRALGAEPVSAELQVAESNGRIRPAFMPNWLFEKELIDGALALVSHGMVDGLLLAASFACGTSAVTNELIRRAVEKSDRSVPVVSIVLDEHSAEAGLLTRLESFVDIIRMQGKE
jgi:predicted nucleotide-binding protein (sugar kinase/HSP70/actin superfamily)